MLGRYERVQKAKINNNNNNNIIIINNNNNNKIRL